jgi:tetratricopeptide (TPR) repeat protein
MTQWCAKKLPHQDDHVPQECNRGEGNGVQDFIQMSGNTEGDIPTQATADLGQSGQAGQVVSEDGSKKHFDTFETDFFQQGDDSASIAVEVERFDDLEEAGRRKRHFLSRGSLMSFAMVTSCMAVVVCVALWRSNSHDSAPAAVAPSPAAVSVVQAAVPAPALVVVPNQPATAEPVAVQTEPALGPPAKSEAVPAPTPLPAVVAKAEAEPTVAASEQSPADDARDHCKKAIGDRRNREILAVCPTAFTADPGAADVAVALAKIEFERGRSARAHAWGKKAIAANPQAADAYVFVGGAEQNIGHNKAAKEAYKQYLRLAPSGRYAADLRAIVESL